MITKKTTAAEKPPFPLRERESQLFATSCALKPQAHYGMSFENISGDLVLSLDEHGNPLSRLTDLTWELSQLKLVVTDNVTFSFKGLLCDKPTNSENIRLTQILFLMRLFSNKGATKSLRASSHVGGFYSLLFMCRHADDNGILIRDLFSRPDFYKPMLESLTPARASVLWQILRIFNITKCPTHWFLIPNTFMKALKKLYKGRSHHTKNQHPVIPPRILNLRWTNYHEVLKDFTLHQEQLKIFLRLAAFNRLYARGAHSQYILKRDGAVRHDAPAAPGFDEACRTHGLYDLFQKYKVRDISGAPKFLSLTQYCAKSLIHILTFMRSGEALLLEKECLEQATGWCEEGVYIVGISTKSTGTPLDTKWITIPEVQTPLNALLQIYELTHPFVPTEHKGIKNLFISPSNIIPRQEAPALLSDFDSTKWEAHLPPIPIQEEDLYSLELIDPSRDWRSEEKFKLGKPWRITSHQFRRTMTVYCAEDDLMTIGPLKRILGHLSRRTSEHYQKGCSAGLLSMNDWSPETVADFKKAALEASNAIYIRDILYSEERLHGVEGRRIQTKKDCKEDVLRETLSEIQTRKKKGLVACTITPVGLCQSVKPCQKRAHADFTTCDGCSESIIKLSKVDYVIEVLRLDLESIDPESFAYRMDAQNLQDLERMRERLIAKSAA